MQSELEQFSEVLGKPDADWKLREETLRKLTKRLEEGRFEAIEWLNSRGSKPLALQIADLRSGIVKGVSEVVVAGCQTRLNNKNVSLERFTENFLREPNLFKGVGSGNKVISGHASLALVSLFETNCVPFSALESFVTIAKGNKNNTLREKVAQCVSVCLENLTSGGTNLPPMNLNTGRVGKSGKVSEYADFFRKTADLFMKDAVGPVRGYAKEMKKRLELVDDAFLVGEAQGNVSYDTTDEIETRFQKGKRAPAEIKQEKSSFEAKTAAAKREEQTFKEPKEVKSYKDIKPPKEPKELPLSRERKDSKAGPISQPRSSKFISEVMVPKNSKNLVDSRELKETRENRETKDTRDTRDTKNSRDLSISREKKSLKDSRDFSMTSASKEPGEMREARVQREQREVKQLPSRREFKTTEKNEIREEVKEVQRKNSMPTNLIDVLRNPNLTAKEKLEQLDKADKLAVTRRASLDDFAVLVESFDSSRTVELRKALLNILEAIDVNSLGPSALVVAMPKAAKPHFSFLNSQLAAAFPAGEFVKLFLENPNLAAALLTREKFSKLWPEELEKEKPLTTQFIKILCQVCAEQNSNEQLRTICAVLLCQTADLSFFESTIFECEAFPAALDFAKKMTVPGLAKLARISLDRKSPAKPADQLESQIKQASPAARKKILAGILSNLETLDPAIPELEVQKIFAKSAEAIVMIADLPLLDTDSLALACRALLTLAMKRLSDQTANELFKGLIALFRKNPKESRDMIVETALGIGFRSNLIQILIAIFQEKSSATNEIVDLLKFYIAYLKMAKASYYYMQILAETKLHADKLVAALKTNLFSHAEVTIRKTVVQLLVQFCHFFDSQDFARILTYFSPEQQKLIQVYIKKSLE